MSDSLHASNEASSPAALSAKRAAEYLATTEGTLNQWRVRGEGPPFVRMGRKIVYRVQDLDRYLEEHLVGGDAR